MQAIIVRQFGGPEVMQLEAVVPDRKPGPHEVLVRIHAAGVNPVDGYIRSGTYAYKPALPYTPGSDGAGTVEAVGSEVASVAPGDRVYVYRTVGGHFGTYAQYAVCTSAQVHPLPDRATFAQGAALGVPYATAFRALFQRAQARPGETVLVHGATGGVGIAAVQLARARGLTVIGTGGSDRGLDAVREQGAHAVFNHGAPGYRDDILRATGGRGVDVVLEMAAHLNLNHDLSLITVGGRIVVIGSRGNIEIEPRGVMRRDAAIFGMTMFNATDADLAEIHAGLVAGLENGTVAPVVSRELPLAEAARSHELVMQPGALGKIVLIP